MSEKQAAQDNGITFDDGAEVEAQETESPEVQTSESAPEDSKAEEQPADGFQKRINKVTADKYAEKRRADELQQKLDELSNAQPAPVVTNEPKLEDFDYDEGAFNQALIDYKVEQKVQAAVQNVTKSQTESVKAEESRKAQSAFNERIVSLAKEDFDVVANNVPLLPDGVADALVRADNGAELIYHLGSHLDLADKVANMSPQLAMMELGRISASLSAAPEVKLSAAPSPIEPLSSGGSISQERGPKGATFE